MIVKHYETPRGAELLTKLPLANPYRYYTLYSLSLGQQPSGAIIHLHSQFEVTNDLGYNVMVAHTMMIHPEETVVSAATEMPDGLFVSPAFPAGENVTPNPGMHHGFRTLCGTITLPHELDAWASVVIYAASDRRTTLLDVEKNYGGLSALVYLPS